MKNSLELRNNGREKQKKDPGRKEVIKKNKFSTKAEIKSSLTLRIPTKSLPDPDAASESFLACFWRWGLPKGL